jgi:hypothetical protein
LWRWTSRHNRAKCEARCALDAHFSRAFRERYGYTPRELRSPKAVVFRGLADAIEK